MSQEKKTKPKKKILLNDISQECVPTGITILDKILGGGILTKSICLITGVTGCGKSQITLQVTKAFKEKGYNILYFDTELAINFDRLKFFNINLEKGTELISYAYSIEELDKIIDEYETEVFMVRPDDKYLIVIDSVSALRSDKILQMAIDDSQQPGIEAKQLTFLLNKMLRRLAKYNITVIVTAHLKQNIQMPMQSFHGTLTDSGYRIPGGAALQYYTGQLISLRKKGTKEIGGINIKYIEAKILKNRKFLSDKTVTLIYNDAAGFSNLLSNIIFLLENKIITNNAGRYSFPFSDNKYSLKEVIQLYKNDKEFKSKLDKLVDEHAEEILIKPYLTMQNIEDTLMDIDDADIILEDESKNEKDNDKKIEEFEL